MSRRTTATSSLVVFLMVALLAALCGAQQDNGDAVNEALRDFQTGLAGIQEAGKNPELLAQLFRDMQDPEMMAEAKKMMENPEWQKHMDQFTKDSKVKDELQKTADKLKDPNTAAHAEAKLEHMLKVGEEKMKDSAAATMQDAMANMANPEVMAEMAAMVKDPNFKSKMEAMAKDPNFKSYIDAMQDMMQDPVQKRKIEAVTEAFKKTL